MRLILVATDQLLRPWGLARDLRRLLLRIRRRHERAGLEVSLGEGSVEPDGELAGEAEAGERLARVAADIANRVAAGDAELMEQVEHAAIEVTTQAVEGVGEAVAVGDVNAEVCRRPPGELTRLNERRARIGLEVALGERAELVEHGVVLDQKGEIP